MKVLLTGAAGYCGSVLHPMLVAAGHDVTGYDNCLPEKSDLNLIGGDIRNHELLEAALEGKEAVIHLAMMSNNDWIEKNPVEADSINTAPFPRFIKAAKRLGVKRFIYASSVAAYGSLASTEEEFDEAHTLRPKTMYGKHKAWCEGWVNAVASEDFCCVRVRAATVCGASPHMRWDTTVNKMLRDAVDNGVIQVNGGEQKRAHIHIADLCAFYVRLLNAPNMLIAGQAFNVVEVNESVAETARRVAAATGCRVDTRDYTDARSYLCSGKKAFDRLGWRNTHTIDDAVMEMARG